MFTDGKAMPTADAARANVFFCFCKFMAILGYSGIVVVLFFYIFLAILWCYFKQAYIVPVPYFSSSFSPCLEVVYIQETRASFRTCVVCGRCQLSR